MLNRSTIAISVDSPLFALTYFRDLVQQNRIADLSTDRANCQQPAWNTARAAPRRFQMVTSQGCHKPDVTPTCRAGRGGRPSPRRLFESHCLFLRSSFTGAPHRLTRPTFDQRPAQGGIHGSAAVSGAGQIGVKSASNRRGARRHRSSRACTAALRQQAGAGGITSQQADDVSTTRPRSLPERIGSPPGGGKTGSAIGLCRLFILGIYLPQRVSWPFRVKVHHR